MTDIEILRRAYGNRNLTLYLGAGISMGSGLPSWDALILAMYFKVMGQQQLGVWRPFPNYLFAIAEWQLQHLQEPLEISARKIRSHFKNDQPAFLNLLRTTLYEGLLQPDHEPRLPSSGDLRRGNPTLNAITELCSPLNGAGIKSVITYNYDSLLEQALDQTRYQPIWKAGRSSPTGELPIYHVHGYVPFEGHERNSGSCPSEIVLTEDQYNRVASDPYSWSNLVQIHCMSSTVGLMIGLSLSDRNMRRLLDAIRNTPIETTHFALLKKPHWRPPSPDELDRINEKAQNYHERFENSGVKLAPGIKGPNWRDEISGILREVQHRASEQEMVVLQEFGIKPIWFDSYSDIPEQLRAIHQQ
jgi:SIR2-like protein